MTDYWRPETLDDLRSFIGNSLAREARWTEFKRQLPRNLDLAKQLAGFAIEGGAIVMGVAEEQDNRFAVRPIPLAGLRERVEQVAQSLVDPPLWIESRVLADDGGENGVLWIDVPQSPQAPHQVDGTYYERGDSQTRPMSDTAVERLMRERSTSMDAAQDALREVMGQSPLFSAIGRTCVAARPIGASPQELYDASGGQANWDQFAREVSRVRSAVRENRSVSDSLIASPDRLRQGREYRDVLSDVQRRLLALEIGAGNWGVLGRSRLRAFLSQQRSREYCSLEFRDDGSVCYVTYSEYSDRSCIQPGLSIAACLDVVALLQFVGRTTSVRRMWDIAMSVTEVKGRETMPLLPGYEPMPTLRFREDNYERWLRVGTPRLERDQWGIARELSQRFVEACGLNFDDEALLLGYQPQPEQ